MKTSSFFIAFFATFVQCYDYALFGISAAVLAKNFMPYSYEADQLLSFFTIFFFAVIARPIGAIIFGFIGDKYGRALSVKIAVTVAAISTIGIGITPDFSTIGWSATILLMLCRMMFVMSLAGEIDATRIYIAEKVGSINRNLGNGIVSFYSQIGAACAAVIYHFSMNIAIADLWRLNFILGGMFGLCVILMRKFFEESQEFVRFQLTNPKKTYHVSEMLLLIKEHKVRFIFSVLAIGCIGGIYNFSIIFLNTFLTKVTLTFDSAYAQKLNIGLIVIYAISALFSGFVADRYNYQRLIVSALVSSCILVIATVINLLSIKHFSVLLVFFLALYSVPIQILVQSMFTIDIRMRMCSFAHAIGSLVFSSTIPMISMLTWKYIGSLSALLFLVLILNVIILISVLMMTAAKPKMKHKVL